MIGSILFEHLLPISIITALAAAAFVMVALSLWRGLPGWWWRGLGAFVVLAALMGPVLQRESRAPLSDIVFLLSDETASQDLGVRKTQTEQALTTLTARLESRGNTEVRQLRIGDASDDGGTAMMSALSEALKAEPLNRVAGIIAVTDGLVHDLDKAPDLPAPLHVLRTGESTDWDRKLTVKNAPAFAILGEPIMLTLRIDDVGQGPDAVNAPLEISVDGGTPQSFTIPLGVDMEVPVTLPHGGRNVLQFTVPMAEDELTDRNNSAIVQINGVRDRLRVLLVSGEPHPGGRTWRNLLKSDSSVDLVHFTILRPPAKQDGVPVNELSLIAFPTRELFLEKIEDFDLIIFDRYKRRGILPALYLDNIVEYVRGGGAVLFSAGPDFATAQSLYRSTLSEIIPAGPSALVIDQPFVPQVSDLGERHPVTAGLQDGSEWGEWLRLIDVVPDRGQVIMTGAGERPLLVLDRVGDGRVALLASDQAWLWARGYDGGGPQLELLRRLAHWMMGEPDLEEEALWAEANGQRMRVMRRSLQDDVGEVTIEAPDGALVTLPLVETQPGQFEATFDGPDMGLYRLTNGDHQAVIGLGPAAPKEFANVVADASGLEPIVASMRGGILAVEEGVPSIRNVRAGRPAAGRGWVGITPRDAFETLSLTRTPLLPGWLVLLILSGFIVGGWLREGRQ